MTVVSSALSSSSSYYNTEYNSSRHRGNLEMLLKESKAGM